MVIPEIQPMTALKKELARAMRDEVFDVTDEGIYFPRQSILAGGEYFDRVNGGEWHRTPNRIVKEGLILLLNVALGSTPKPSNFYLALFSGNVTPEANWTAANFHATATEITSMEEGYTSPTRPEWVSTNASADTHIDNMDAVATLTIAASSAINVNGCALLTNNTRGGTLGVLVSATKYAATRVLQNDDTFDVGYRLALTV